jgi:hypothetical protein
MTHMVFARFDPRVLLTRLARQVTKSSQVKVMTLKKSQSHDFDFFWFFQKSQSHDFDFFWFFQKSQSHDFDFFQFFQKSQSHDFDFFWIFQKSQSHDFDFFNFSKKVKVMTWLLGDLAWLFLKKMTFCASLGALKPMEAMLKWSVSDLNQWLLGMFNCNLNGKNRQ